MEERCSSVPQHTQVTTVHNTLLNIFRRFSKRGAGGLPAKQWYVNYSELFSICCIISYHTLLYKGSTIATCSAKTGIAESPMKANSWPWVWWEVLQKGNNSQHVSIPVAIAPPSVGGKIPTNSWWLGHHRGGPSIIFRNVLNNELNQNISKSKYNFFFLFKTKVAGKWWPCAT